MVGKQGINYDDAWWLTVPDYQPPGLSTWQWWHKKASLYREQFAQRLEITVLFQLKISQVSGGIESSPAKLEAAV